MLSIKYDTFQNFPVVRGRHQILLLVLSEFKRICQLLSHQNHQKIFAIELN